VKSKKAMLGNLIGGFIVILIGVTLLPMIAQQISLATSCPIINQTNITLSDIPQADTGDTNSFGGGGTGHFGGYTGKVEHPDFLGKVGEYSMVKSNTSIFGTKDCSNLTEGYSSQLVGLVTIFLAIAIITSAIVICFTALRNGGIILI
jgi:hypothetical protein